MSSKKHRDRRGVQRQYTITVPSGIADLVQQGMERHAMQGQEAEYLRTCLSLGVAMSLNHPGPEQEGGAGGTPATLGAAESAEQPLPTEG